MKRLFVGKKSKSGRGIKGNTINLNSFGGLKKNLCIIDNFRNWSTNLAICLNLSKDSNRTCFIALIKYSNGTFSYILASSKLKPGNIVFTSVIPKKFTFKYNTCCSVLLKYLNYRSIFFNISYNSKGGVYCKSAGTYSKILSINSDRDLAKIILPTGLIKIISVYNLVILGRASNIHKNNFFLSKAGYNVKKGFRPNVRGVAMNPVDNPHGGRTKTNSPELTPWGKIAKKGK